MNPTSPLRKKDIVLSAKTQKNQNSEQTADSMEKQNSVQSADSVEKLMEGLNLQSDQSYDVLEKLTCSCKGRKKCVYNCECKKKKKTCGEGCSCYKLGFCTNN